MESRRTLGSIEDGIVWYNAQNECMPPKDKEVIVQTTVIAKLQAQLPCSCQEEYVTLTVATRSELSYGHQLNLGYVNFDDDRTFLIKIDMCCEESSCVSSHIKENLNNYFDMDELYFYYRDIQRWCYLDTPDVSISGEALL